jgi:Fibrobacter succinogenes major domain (Fib_succ_major).
MVKIIKHISRFGFATAICIIPFLFGCSGDSSNSSVNMYVAEGEYVKSKDDLQDYECSSAREGVIVYLSSEDTRMVCSQNKWIDYSKWQSQHGINSSSSKKNKSSSSSVKSKSSSSTEYGSAGSDSLYGASFLGSVKSLQDLPECDKDLSYRVVYVEDIDAYLRCYKSNWAEAFLGDDLSNYSEGEEPECNKKNQGQEIRISFINYVCYNSEWISLNADSTENDTWDPVPLEYDVKHVLPDYRDSVLGPCTKEKYGTIVHDTSLTDYSSNAYFRCNDKGYWYALSNAEADTFGLKPVSEGSFALGRYSTYNQKEINLPEECIVHGDLSQSPVYYVYDNKAWRRAAPLEICKLYACLKSNEGEEYNLFGYLFRCENSTWVQDSIQNIPKKDFFNPNISYGTLKDSRDGKTYKTVEINGKTWMAENLNYYDTTQNIMGNSNCYLNNEEYCENMGRYYFWTAAMNIAPSYATEMSPPMESEIERQGVCPSGWHIPDTLEWDELTVSYTTNDLMFQKGWLINLASSNVRVLNGYFNTTGFSVVPVNLPYDTRRGVVGYNEIGRAAFLCTSNRYDQEKFFAAEFSFSNVFLRPSYAYSKLYMNAQCSVRCVKNSED